MRLVFVIETGLLELTEFSLIRRFLFFFNRNKKYLNKNNARINSRLISGNYFIYF